MKTARRLTAVVLAVFMFLSLSNVNAESRPMQASRAMALLEEGKAIETTATITLDGQTVSALFGMFSGGQSDPQMQTIVDTVISAVNKMQMHALMSKNAASGSVGTEKGELFNFSGSMDIKTSENAGITSLMPGHVFRIAPSLIKPMLDQSAAMQLKPEQIEQMMGQYLAAGMQYYETSVKPDLTIEEGAFAVEGIGDYTLHIKGQPTTRHLAGMMLALEKVAREDEALDEMFTSLAAAMKQQGADDEGFPKDLGAMLDEMKKGADAMMTEEPQTIASLDIYYNEKTRASYVQTETPIMDGAASHVSVIANPTENGSQTSVSVLIKTPAPVYSADGSLATPAPAAPLDWAKVREDIMAGQDPASMMINVTMNSAEDAAANKTTTNAQMQLFTGGMPFTFGLVTDETLTGLYEANSVLSIAFLSPTPIMTITQKSVESEKQPALGDLTGLKEVVLSEEMSEEDMAPLAEVFEKQTMPQLLENLKKALPEEAGILLLLLQTQPGDGTITQVN